MKISKIPDAFSVYSYTSTRVEFYSITTVKGAEGTMELEDPMQHEEICVTSPAVQDVFLNSNTFQCSSNVYVDH